jgi:arsenite/tail-anchored protein-transporting ATPase
VIGSEATTVRLVVEPGPAGARALRTARAGLALHGCRVEAVVANRLLPVGSADPWLAAVSDDQQAAVKELSAQWPDVPLRELPHLGRDPGRCHGRDGACPGRRQRLDAPADADADSDFSSGSGADPGSGPGPGADLHADPGADPRLGPACGAGPTCGLRALAAAVGAPGDRPERPAAEPWSVEDHLGADGVLVWRMPLPGATRDALGLVRRGDELLVTVGPFHRALPLPSALRRCTVAGAGLRDGDLRVRFAPDPALWPSGR